MEFLQFIGTNLLNACQDGVSALARAKQARNEEEKNRALHKVAECLIRIGMLNASVVTGAVIYQPDNGDSARLINIGSLFSPIIICFFLTALSAFVAGLFLFFINNPGGYIKLATCAIFAASAGAVLAIGILIATSFATLRT